MSSALKVRIAWVKVSSQERAKVGNVEICVSRNLRAVWTYGLLDFSVITQITNHKLQKRTYSYHLPVHIVWHLTNSFFLYTFNPRHTLIHT